MLFWIALVCIPLAFFLPIFLASKRRKGDGAAVGCFLTLLTVVSFQIATYTSTEKQLSLSDVDYAVTEVEGEKTLFVQHPKDDFKSNRATLAENIGDTTQVEIILGKNESVWFGPSYYLSVQSK